MISNEIRSGMFFCASETFPRDADMPGLGKSSYALASQGGRRHFEAATIDAKADGSYVGLVSADSRKEKDSFDIESLFKRGKEIKKTADAGRIQHAAAFFERAQRVQKKTIGARGHTRKRRKDVDELVPVDKPRRFEDGLPVYKSYEGFSDIACGQVPPDSRQGGKCPFDCWCCF